MEHIVYVDAQAQELERLLDGSKTMIVRGAAVRKMPYGRVKPGDTLYFVRNNGDGTLQARAKVKRVYDSDPMPAEESLRLLRANQPKAQLTNAQLRQWACKRYLVFVEVGDVTPIPPVALRESVGGAAEDWLAIGSIEALVDRE